MNNLELVNFVKKEMLKRHKPYFCVSWFETEDEKNIASTIYTLRTLESMGVIKVIDRASGNIISMFAFN